MSLKKSIAMLFSFFLAFFLFAFTLLCVTRITLMNPSYILSSMNSIEFYENAITELNQSIRQNARPAGFPVELFDNYLDVEDVNVSMQNYIKDGFNGDFKEMSTADFEMKLSDTMNSYIREEGIQVNKSTQTGIDSFVRANVENYHHFLEFPFLKYYVQGYELYSKIFLLGAPVVALLSLIMGFALFRIHNSRRKKKRMYAYSLIGSGLLCSVLPLYLLGTKFFERIQLSPQYLYNLVTHMTKNYMMILVVIGIVMIGLGFFITYFKIKKKGHIKRDYSKSVMYSSLKD